MDNLQYIIEKFDIDPKHLSPVRLPIDKYKLFPALLKELGCSVGAEIGVNKGKFSKWLCHKIRPLKLFLIDPYTTYQDMGYYADQERQEANYAEAQVRLARYNCEFVRKSSMEALRDFNDNSLDFVYIDANHSFKYVINDIIEWHEKVKPGGIVSGHDYSNYMREVKIAVNAWTEVKRINLWFTTGYNNWFYVK